MRLIGTIEGDQRAAKFSDYLYTRGIENNVERDDASRFEVWVSDDDQLAEATQLLQQFMANPESPEYAGAENAARKQRAREVAEAEAAEKRVFNSGQVLNRQRTGAVTVTVLLIVISISVAFLTSTGKDVSAVQPWVITKYQSTGDSIMWLRGLPEIRKGEVWRLITPIFLHFGSMHLFFNMYCLIFLGTMIERSIGSLKLLFMVIIIAAISNLAEYAITIPRLSSGAPNFGGMSGVVFALFGYAWMRSKYDFASGIEVQQLTIVMMLISFVIGLTGKFAIANMVHSVGLAGGLLWGIIDAKRRLR